MGPEPHLRPRLQVSAPRDPQPLREARGQAPSSWTLVRFLTLSTNRNSKTIFKLNCCLEGCGYLFCNAALVFYNRENYSQLESLFSLRQSCYFRRCCWYSPELEVSTQMALTCMQGLQSSCWLCTRLACRLPRPGLQPAGHMMPPGRSPLLSRVPMGPSFFPEKHSPEIND